MKKITTILALIIAFVFVLSACAKTENIGTTEGTTTEKMKDDKVKYSKITPKEAKERMEKNAEAIILDVRTEEEYKIEHIENAILIPNETIIVEDGKPKELPDFDAEILVYCRSGNRSAQAANKLIEMGYTNVHDFGGINEWEYDTIAGK